jgi:hypothetical protein
MFSDNTAISTVVSFILIIGLLVTVIAFVKVQYVPSWTEDAEARHARDVFVDFSAIPCNIDNLVLANGSVTVSQQRIKLGSGGIPIVAPGMSYGTLGVVPDDGSFTVTADVWNVNISRNTTDGNLTEGCVNITNVSSVSSFYIYIGEIKYYESASAGSLSIDLTHQGNQSGGAEITTTNNTTLNISVRNSDNCAVIEDLPINADGSEIRNYKIDLLNPRYGFCKVLSDADVPYNLTITNSTSLNGSHIHYIIGYNEYNRTRELYTETTNGTIIYESRNRQFINQRFIYQNGAIFLCQLPNVGMRVAPGIAIENVTNRSARMMIPMVSLGVGRYRIPMISGSGVEELQLELNCVNRSSFADGNNTDKVTILIEPPEGDPEFRNNYLQEWADYFNATVAGTLVEMSKPVPAENNSSITITLTGNIHLEIRDLDVEGRISSIL